MSVSNLALYRLLVKFGATEDEAETAATLDASTLATKADIADLKVALASLEAALAWKVITAMVSLTGIFALIVAWLTRGAR
jgi:hypothetical protein